MAIQYLGTTISGVSGDTKPSIGADTISANEKGVLFIETDTNKMYQWDGDSWNEVTPTNTTALSSGRTIGMTGDVTWTSASFDGSGNVTGTAAIGTGVVVNADVNASAAIAMSKTALVGGTGLTLATNTLNVDAAQTQITSVGDLDGGSITSNFGSIDTGTSNITTTGTITAGNLSVTGTTTTVNSTNTTITDRLIELASGASASTADAGIIIERGSTGNNAIMAWDEANDRFIFGTTEATGSSTGTLTISVGTVNADIVGNVTGRADTATTLHTARTIGGVSFNGSANINLSGVNVAGNQDTSGNAATATVLETARTIGGTSFDGSANISVALADTATTLATARTIGGTSFDGSANIAVALAATATALANARTIGGVSFDGTANINLPGVNASGTQDTSGNAATATILETARTLGGVSFNGSANIDLPGVNIAGNQNTTGSAATLTTPRTIGGVSFNGSANINLPGVNTSGSQDTSGTAAIATTVTLAGSGNVTYYPTFVDATSGNEAVRVDTDGDWTYNASTNKMTVTNIGIPDSGKIELGASQDLQIYHDGSNSYIKDAGTGALFVFADTFRVRNAANSEDIISMAQDGAVELYHNNVKRIETTAAGATVTGDLTVSTDLQVNGGDITTASGDLTLNPAGVLRSGSTINLGNNNVYDFPNGSDWTSGSLNILATNITLDGDGKYIYLKGGVADTDRTGIAWTFNTADTKYAEISLDYDTRGTVGVEHRTSHYPISFDAGYSETSSDFVNFKVNQSDIMRLTKTSVGIGIASPAARLDIFKEIAGTTSTLTAQNYNAVNIYANNYGNTITSSTNYGLMVKNRWAGYNAPGTFTSSQGIAAKFIVDSSWGVLPNAFGVVVQPRASNHQTISNYYGLYVEAPDLHDGNGIITNRFGLYVADSSYTNYFAGKVGIGTSTLTAAAGLAIKKNGDNLYLEQSNADNGWILQTLDADGHLHFERRGEGGSPSNTERVVFTTTGNVGIGVAAPDQKLEVAGAIHMSGEVSSPSAPSDGDGGIMYTKADGKLYFISNETAEVELSSSGGGGGGAGTAIAMALVFGSTYS